MNPFVAWSYSLAFVLTVLIALACVRAALRRPPEAAFVGNRFVYKYQRHPFDDPQFFVIFAPDPATADTLAVAHFDALFVAKVTVMVQFYRAGVNDVFHPNFPK